MDVFHPAVRDWFTRALGVPTPPQAEGWPAIARGESTLILAPTGTGKTLAAFLASLDRLMFSPVPAPKARCRVLYISPLKALAVDVDRNLRAPLDGIAAASAAMGLTPHVPSIFVRTGDTPPSERARFSRAPSDILITTPESLFLMLTSDARRALASVETVIIDEIHALVPTKRGAHLSLSLERLEAITDKPLQRIGLSATQRPLDEVARFLGGLRKRTPRPVTIVDTGVRKPLQLSIEVPVEDMSRVSDQEVVFDPPRRSKPGTPARTSIWSAIHPRLLELVNAHRTTLIFVNNRRLAERLAGSLNELAGEVLVRSHHGSLAREQRVEVEDALKAGQLRALVATSSLELGIDMGAIDLVVQIEAPPSVASGLQRIGRAGHQVGAPSEGVIFPKFRGDLLACAAVTRSMHAGRVEATRYPRNPIDVLAQQLVAMVGIDDEPAGTDALFALSRQAAPFADMTRASFDGVLDMLSGRYPNDQFAELRPRITWDRRKGVVRPRAGAKAIAIANAGTIPDKGLFGVFLVGTGRHNVRVGELDEEMVFESRVNDVFVLGASSWRIEEITHDRVLVTPAPGQPGRMPFWKGDSVGRPIELGLEIGELTRELVKLPAPAAIGKLTRDHDMTRQAAENLVAYVRDEQQAVGAVPDADTIVIERVRDELGDWRMCVLSPRGGRVHAPWCIAVSARIRRESGLDVETLYSDEGFVVRFPELDQAPDPAWVIPEAGDVEALLMQELGGTALFAARFRENAARALLLPRRRAGQRAPLWQQRKRAGDLLAVASKFPSFPIVLETYRECLRDVFDLPALIGTLKDIGSHAIDVKVVDPRHPSPFAASLLYGYVANFIYDGDAPLAERRAQALSVDSAQLRELIGDAELRDLLDPQDIADVERHLQRLDAARHARSADGVHDLVRELGDLSIDELRTRTSLASGTHALERVVADLTRDQRVIEVNVAGARRIAAVEDAARLRDALGVSLPSGLPATLLEPAGDPLGDVVRRYARTHTAFTAEELGARLGLTMPVVVPVLTRLAETGAIVRGDFRPGGREAEWCDASVLAMIRSRSLARLRREIEPVDAGALARLTLKWQGIGMARTGPDALLDVIEQLQGAPLLASALESEVLPARLAEYDPEWLDALMAAGEVVWRGLDSVGPRDGRIALYLADRAAAIAPRRPRPSLDAGESRLIAALQQGGAQFFADLLIADGNGYPNDTVDRLWSLVWKGLVTNDTMHVLRAFLAPAAKRRADRARAFRSRRMAPAKAEGRWSLTPTPDPGKAGMTEWTAATGHQLLARFGIVTRESVRAEEVAGGFSSVYPVFKAMEEAGRLRRGYFIAGLGATQFALSAALDTLRALRDVSDAPAEVAVLAATDPANPYGAAVPWPFAGAMRGAGALVWLVDGVLAAYLSRGGRALTTALPAEEPARSRVARALASSLAERARRPAGLLIAEINGTPAAADPLAVYLVDAGLVLGSGGAHDPHRT